MLPQLDDKMPPESAETRGNESEERGLKKTPAIHPYVLLKMIGNLLEFPLPQICIHHVAASLLSILEEHGIPLSKELAGAIVRAEDEAAKPLLQALLSQLAPQEPVKSN